MSDAAGSRVVYAAFDGSDTCAALRTSPVAGVLERAGPKYAATLRKLGFDAQGDSFAMCTWCGPGNDRIGLILGIIFAMIGAAFYPIVKRVDPAHLTRRAD